MTQNKRRLMKLNKLQCEKVEISKVNWYSKDFVVFLPIGEGEEKIGLAESLSGVTLEGDSVKASQITTGDCLTLQGEVSYKISELDIGTFLNEYLIGGIENVN